MATVEPEPAGAIGTALSPLEAVIYNDGERLIPGVTHDKAELVRHRSSYAFWRTSIARDRRVRPRNAPVSIVDLGCGVGHGCVTLAELPGAAVVGVDNSEESLSYADDHYGRPNIEYVRADLVSYFAEMPPFDYVVSRGVLEHIPRGLELARAARRRSRLMFDVPYDEDVGVNPLHVVHNVREDEFASFENRDLFFQDLAGVIYDVAGKPPRPNMIMCIASRDGLPSVSRTLRFPIPAWPEEAPQPRRVSLLSRFLMRR